MVEQYESLNLALFLRAMSALSYTVILRVNVGEAAVYLFRVSKRQVDGGNDQFLHASFTGTADKSFLQNVADKSFHFI